MIKSGRAALSVGLAAAFAVWAAPASADIVQFGAAGFFYEVTGPTGWYSDPISFCPGVPCYISRTGGRDHVDFNGSPLASYPAFNLDFTIDTDRGNLSQGPGLATFDWVAADGPSPLLSGLLDLSFPGSLIDLTTVTNISLRSAAEGATATRNTLTLGGPEFALSIILYQLSAVPSLTQTQTGTPTYFGMYSNVSTGPYDLSFTNTQSFAITNLRPSPAPIPEPASWGLLLLGFGGVGCVLRRRHRRSETVVGRASIGDL